MQAMHCHGYHGERLLLSTAGNIAVGWVSHVVGTPEGWLPAGAAQASFAVFILSSRPPLNINKMQNVVNIRNALFGICFKAAHERQAAASCSLCCMNIEGAAAAPSGGIGRRQEASAGLEPAITQEDRGEWIKGPLTAAQRRAWRDKLGGSWKWSQALPGARLPDVLLSCHMCLCRHTWHGTNLCLSWPYVLRHKIERPAGERTCFLARCAQTDTR